MTGFKPGDRVRQIAWPDKPGTVLQDPVGDGWIAVQFDGGGGVFGTGVVDVPPEALELVPEVDHRWDEHPLGWLGMVGWLAVPKRRR